MIFKCPPMIHGNLVINLYLMENKPKKNRNSAQNLGFVNILFKVIFSFSTHGMKITIKLTTIWESMCHFSPLFERICHFSPLFWMKIIMFHHYLGEYVWDFFHTSMIRKSTRKLRLGTGKIPTVPFQKFFPNLVLSKRFWTAFL